jgi:hypothetical protein
MALTIISVKIPWFVLSTARDSPVRVRRRGERGRRGGAGDMRRAPRRRAAQDHVVVPREGHCVQHGHKYDEGWD